MSDKLGPIAYGKNDAEPFLGRDISRPHNYSEATAQAIDQEIRETVMMQYRRAREILQTNVDALSRLASALIEREALGLEEVEAAIEGRPLPIVEDMRPVKVAAAAKPSDKEKVRAPMPVAEPT